MTAVEPILTIQVRETPGAIRVNLVGELDISTVSLVADAVEGVESRETPLVLDLCGLDFVDAAGLRALLEASLRLGERLSIVQASRAVTRVLELAGLAQLLDPARFAARGPYIAKTA